MSWLRWCLLYCVLAAPTSAPKPKGAAPPAAKPKGAGLYTAGGRVYPAHEDVTHPTGATAEDYRKWLAMERAKAAKKTKSAAPPAPHPTKGRVAPKKPKKHTQ